MSIDTIERAGTVEDIAVGTTANTRLHEPGDHERMTHAVKTEDLNRAVFEGDTIRAVCGKTWRPDRDPKSFPMCPECKDFLEATQRPDGDAPYPEHNDLSYD